MVLGRWGDADLPASTFLWGVAVRSFSYLGDVCLLVLGAGIVCGYLGVGVGIVCLDGAILSLWYSYGSIRTIFLVRE